MERSRSRARAARHAAALLALLGAAAPSLSAQGDRAVLLSARDDYSQYNDIWGYESGGREIAIVGTWAGTAFYETTDPFNPVLKAFVSRNTSTWSDLKTLGTYAYVVTEGGGGLQIIDLANLDNIHLVATYNGFSSAHNLYIDTAAKVAYVPGANTGMPILDLSNPVAPVQIANYTTQYVHDVFVQDGYAHLAEIYAGRYRILDVSNLPTLTALGSVVTPGAFTHNTWTNAASTICGTTDEVVGGHLALYDITNKNNPVKVGEYTDNSGGIIHNVVIDGDLAHISYYAEGYVLVDVSDPSRPHKVASYDTYAGSSGNYDGAWGVYPFQPSGVVYLNDIHTGLYVVARRGTIEHDDLGDTLDPAGPYTVTAQVKAGPASGGLFSATLRYSTDEGATFTSVAMVPTGNPDEFTADIPGQPLGSVVRYEIEGVDGLGTFHHPLEGEQVVFAVGERTVHYFNDFEGATDEGWTHGQNKTQDDWQRGTPTGKGGDPSYAASGTKCWGNDLGGSGFNGYYQNDVDNWLDSPPIDLSNVRRARLRFKRWVTVQDRVFDVARVRVNGQGVWSNPAGADLTDTDWVDMDLDISDVADGVANTVVRFLLKTDSTDVFGGWNLDDFEIYSVSDCGPPEHYGAGWPGSGGFLPTIDASGEPFLGNNAFTLDAHDLLGGANTLLAVGFARANFPFKDFAILVDITQFHFLFPVKATGPGGVPGAGDVVFSAPIPNDPAAVGLEVDCQYLVLDPGASRGWAGTDGLAFVICEGDGS